MLYIQLTELKSSIKYIQCHTFKICNKKSLCKNGYNRSVIVASGYETENLFAEFQIFFSKFSSKGSCQFRAISDFDKKLIDYF